MGESKNISDFLLTEYENLAQAHFNAHEILSRWVRFYFLVVAAPLTLLALLSSKNKVVDVDILHPPLYFSLVIFLVGFVGVFISLIIFDMRLDATLYARCVNGIRKYFVEKERRDALNSGQESPVFDPSPYIVLPRDIHKPSLTKLSPNDWVFVLMFAYINALYLSFGTAQFLAEVEQPCRTLLLILVCLVVLLFHPLGHWFIGKRKEKNYGRPTDVP
jgi:hypothetical protein